MKVEIWSDVVCPWCYIGKRRFERALHWTRRGILLARLEGNPRLAETLEAVLPERESAASQ